MTDTKWIKKEHAPDNLSSKAINEFKLGLTSISKKISEGNILTFENKKEIKLYETMADEDLLHKYLTAHKENKDFKTVIQKVKLIDCLYSTNLRMSGSNTFADITNIILNISDFDERVERGCLDLVNEIAKSVEKATGKNHFSFVTKYCCNHNYHIYDRDDYSIYDTAMKKAISKYLNVTQTFIEDECRKKMDYKLYHSIVENMIKEYSIETKHPRRDTDLYLWYHYR